MILPLDEKKLRDLKIEIHSCFPVHFSDSNVNVTKLHRVCMELVTLRIDPHYLVNKKADK